MSGGCFPTESMGKLFSRPKSTRWGRSNKYEVPDQSHDMEVAHVRHFTPVHVDGVMCVSAARRNCCLSGSKDKSIVLFDFDQG